MAYNKGGQAKQSNSSRKGRSFFKDFLIPAVEGVRIYPPEIN